MNEKLRNMKNEYDMAVRAADRLDETVENLEKTLNSLRAEADFWRDRAETIKQEAEGIMSVANEGDDNAAESFDWTTADNESEDAFFGEDPDVADEVDGEEIPF